MSIGSNIQYLRYLNQMTQEQFAEKMNVSIQTVSSWESDEVTPELSKLVDMSSLFSCKIDEIIKEDMSSKNPIYSEVKIRKVPGFKMARYIMISPNPEADVQAYMENWAIESGLLWANPEAKQIGWDFPFVSQEQQTRFGLHGYAAAYVIPEGFGTQHPGVEYVQNSEAEYAVITVTEPFAQPFDRIPKGYEIIRNYLQANNLKEEQSENVLGCFEHEYIKDGVIYMDIYVHVAGVTTAD